MELPALILERSKYAEIEGRCGVNALPLHHRLLIQEKIWRLGQGHLCLGIYIHDKQEESQSVDS